MQRGAVVKLMCVMSSSSTATEFLTSPTLVGFCEGMTVFASVLVCMCDMLPLNLSGYQDRDDSAFAYALEKLYSLIFWMLQFYNL